MKHRPPVTADLVRAALGCIPANCPRDEWAKVLAAVKSQFDDETGFALVDRWSATAPENYSAKSTRATWKSVKASGGVTIASLFFLAKRHGFAMPKNDQAAPPPDPAEAARQQSARAERQRAEQARQLAGHERAADQSAQLWAEASDAGQSGYLDRKGIKGYGVRFTPDGRVLVPLRDVAGRLWNLQIIAPSKPDDGAPEKSFLKGSRKAGLFHVLGDLATLSSAGAGPALICIAEGFATAATIFEATGRVTVCAFDAGNLAPVCKALHQAHPAALIVICGDDDLQTFERTGQNPGRDKATAAARSVQGIAIFPENLPAGGSDFNDQSATHGLAAVRAAIATAITAHQAAQTAARAAQNPKPTPHNQDTPRTPTDPPNAKPFDRFQVDDDGVWHIPPAESGMPILLCGPLRVTGFARDAQDNQAGLLLEFDTPYRKNRRWLMPLQMLAGDGNAYRSALLSQGFMMPTDAKRRALLTQYLQSRDPGELVRHVPRVGWHGRCYVLPHETLGENPSGEKVIFHSEAGAESNFSQRGNIEQWRQDLARLCIGNSRAAFAVATAFAGPLLAFASGATPGGFHFTGATSIGKTTCFLLAATVWGRGSEKDSDAFVQKWRSTSNGLEYQAEAHSDCCLILDEIGQMDASDLGASLYMLADGAGKIRSKGAGGLRPKPTWRLLILSSGELSPAQHMETVGKTMRGGQETRLIPLPSEVAPGSALETFHEFASGHELSGHVQHHAARCYGTAGRVWLEYLVANIDGLSATLRERMDSIEAQLLPSGAAGQVKRGARRFALVAAAGEMSRHLTGWPEGEATRAAQICFKAWVDSRGGAGSSEVVSMLRAVRRFLEQHGEGAFTWWHRAGDDHNVKTLARAGYRRMVSGDGVPIKTDSDHQREFGERLPTVMAENVTVEYYIFRDTFRYEVCSGYDHQAVCRVLLDVNCLLPDKGRSFDCKPRLPINGLTWCYRISNRIFDLDL